MNRTKLLHTVLSIALIASVGGNFYNYSQSKTLSNALYDSTKQVETLTQELEQSQLALEAANDMAELAEKYGEDALAGPGFAVELPRQEGPLNKYIDKNQNGIKDYIEEGRVFDARIDADPNSRLYKDAIASEKRSEEILKAIAEGRLDEHIKANISVSPDILDRFK